MGKSAKKKPLAQADDDLTIPAFLRDRSLLPPVKPGAAMQLRTDDVPAGVPYDCKAAYRALAPQLVQLLTGLERGGRFRWDWLREPSTVAHFARQLEEKEQQRQAATQQLARRGGQLAGLVPLAKLLEGLQPPVLPRHAKQALQQAAVPHISWHVEPADVDKARQAIAAYVPPPEPEGGGSGWRGPKLPDHDPKLLIGWVKGKENPKRPGSGAHARWEKLRTSHGSTVGAFLADGGNPETLHNALKAGCVVLGLPGDKVDEAKPKKERKK